MFNNIRDARIVEPMHEAFDSSADMPWILSDELGDLAGRLPVAEHGNDEALVIVFEPMGAVDELVGERVGVSFSQVDVVCDLVEPVDGDWHDSQGITGKGVV